jgi:hypothetical protein
VGNEKELNAYVLLGEIMAYAKNLPEEEREEFLRKGTILYRTLVKVCESLRAIMIPDPVQCKVTHCPFCPPECDFKNNPLGPIEAK